MRQRRLGREAAARVEHFGSHAEALQQGRPLPGLGEIAGRKKQMQDALAQPIELDAGFAQQGVQAIPAVQGEPDDGEGVGTRP